MDVFVDVSCMCLETERLLLRPFEQTDLEDFFTYASVPGVGEMAGWPHHQDRGVTRGVLEEFIREKKVLGLYHLEDKKLIGSLGFHRSWANEDERWSTLKLKEIGYVLAKAYWGKGLMPEAVDALIADAACRFDIEAFSCCHISGNDQSRRVIEKCGFEFVSAGIFYSALLKKSFEDRRYIRLIREAGGGI